MLYCNTIDTYRTRSMSRKKKEPVEIQAIRGLFPPGNVGTHLLTLALKLRTPEEIMALRKKFNNGQAGNQAFYIIAAGAQCAARINGEQCPNVAAYTLDFDVMAEAEHIPVCSKQHGQMVQKEVAHDLHLAVNDPTFGMNGNGRG